MSMEETPQQQQEAKIPIPDDLVNAFIEITSASHQEALFFLESHGFDLDSAVSTFLETNSLPAPISTDEPDSVPSRRSRNRYRNLNRSPSNSPSQSSSPSRSRSRSRSPPPSVELELPVVNSYNLRSGRSDKKKASSSRAPGSVRTISDLNRAATDDEDSDSDAPQEYYTGGEKSGMLVQDPSKKNNDVEALFNQVRQAGAEEGPIDHLQPSSSSRSFSGRARLLSGETVASSSVPQEPITHTITFWTNGFTIDDGPLQRLDDPENASFLESIRKSECPKELKPATNGAAVHVSLVRKFEDCPVPQKRLKPFHGIARTLGSTSGTATEASAVPETSLNTAPTPSVGLVVDQTLPSTSIQLRLVDGTRMVSRFNLHHTISDIRSFIDASRPDGERAYQLQTMEFPPKQLTDPNQTIEQAGIANSVVIQKL